MLTMFKMTGQGYFSFDANPSYNLAKQIYMEISIGLRDF